MRHRCGLRKLNRTSAHRKALLKSLTCALLEHEEIQTTLAKARTLRPVVEKLITLGKKDSPYARYKARRSLPPVLVRKLFSQIGQRFVDRAGGYTRIMKIGERKGDNAPMALIALVDQREQPQQTVTGENNG